MQINRITSFIYRFCFYHTCFGFNQTINEPTHILNNFPSCIESSNRIRCSFFSPRKFLSLNNIWKAAYRKGWTLDVWSGRLDSGRLDSGRLDAWTLDTWTLDPWTLSPWTQKKSYPFLVISFLLLFRYIFR